MVGFVIPFRPKANSKDWEKEQFILSRTVNSILNQTDKRFKIYIVYSDLPKLEIDNKFNQVELIEFPYSYMYYADMILNDYDRVHTARWLERNTDKAKKGMFGSKCAIEANCSYIMQVDSDDLISNNIVSYVMQQFGKPGWYIDKGYIFYEKKKLLIKQPKNMNFVNGSTHIVRQDLVPLLDLTDKEISEFYFFAAHGYLKDRIKQIYSLDIDPLPFFANIYIASGINQSSINESLTLRSFKSIVKAAIRYTYLSKSIKKEFGLYSIYE